MVLDKEKRDRGFQTRFSGFRTELPGKEHADGVCGCINIKRLSFYADSVCMLLSCIHKSLYELFMIISLFDFRESVNT